jgi:magnesium transporter
VFPVANGLWCRFGSTREEFSSGRLFDFTASLYTVRVPRHSAGRGESGALAVATKKSRKKKIQPDNAQLVLAALEENNTARVREILTDLHPADTGALLEGLPPEQRHPVWALVDPQVAGEVLLEVSEAVRQDLIREMDAGQLVIAARALDIDDVADLIPDLSDEAIAEILFTLDKQDRQRLDAVLSYPEDTAGGLMNVDTVTVRENITLEVVLRYLRSRGELPEHTHSLFVVDRSDRLLGMLPLEKVLTSGPALRVAQVMERDLVSFPALTPDKEVSEAFERYNLITAPVVDESGRLLGRITVDDVVDVIREEADREILNLAGLREEEDLFAPVWQSVRNRWLWLALNLVTAVIASRVIGLFEPSIEKLVALAALMPIVAGIGGNSGNQTITLIVRALALGQLDRENMRKLFLKELGVALINGLVWGALLGIIAWALYGNVPLAFVMTAAMTLNLLLASVAGVGIPYFRQKFGKDPALGSSVLITAITDSGGFFIFLGLATLLLM